MRVEIIMAAPPPRVLRRKQEKTRRILCPHGAGLDVGVLHLEDTYPVRVPHYDDTSRSPATHRRSTFHARHATEPASVVPTACGASKHVASTVGPGLALCVNVRFFVVLASEKQSGIPFTTEPGEYRLRLRG
ncbi:hypothetical protein MTO96_030703 [Rhipicephalus appendiculatus]